MVVVVGSTRHSLECFVVVLLRLVIDKLSGGFGYVCPSWMDILMIQFS